MPTRCWWEWNRSPSTEGRLALSELQMCAASVPILLRGIIIQTFAHVVEDTGYKNVPCVVGTD